ncbi:MAG TPA: hypothetical protein VFO10_25265, partial [Oligoflexus sp.]|uniref:hypothetical protein n=1 Tax=Oligoflexus sp. TaxID=1971216 RepID=UPI002D80E325
MSGFSYIHVSRPNRGPFIAFAAKAQLTIERWNASQTDDLKALFRSVDDGIMVELVEGRQSLWYSLSRKPEHEKVTMSCVSDTRTKSNSLMRYNNSPGGFENDDDRQTTETSFHRRAE